MARYCLVSYILCLRRVSSRLSKRFPTVQSIVTSGEHKWRDSLLIRTVRTGLLDQYEGSLIGEEESGDILESNWWLPLKWSTEVLAAAVQADLITSAPGYTSLISRLTEFRAGLCDVATYGQIRVELTKSGLAVCSIICN